MRIARTEFAAEMLAHRLMTPSIRRRLLRLIDINIQYLAAEITTSEKASEETLAVRFTVAEAHAQTYDQADVRYREILRDVRRRSRVAR